MPLAALRWDGHAWHRLAAYVRNGVLNDVSCQCSDWCMAVGRTNTNVPVTDFWNGRTWKPTYLQLPAADVADSMTGISRTSRSRCLAIGSFQGNTAGSTAEFVERAHLAATQGGRLLLQPPHQRHDGRVAAPSSCHRWGGCRSLHPSSCHRWGSQPVCRGN